MAAAWESQERFDAGLDRIYEDFTSRVAEGRGLAIEQVLDVARGRIWTGEEAKELGLVDELGGVETALRVLREEIGLEPDAPLRLKHFPRRRSPWELFLPGGRNKAALQSLAQSLREVQPKVRILRQLGILGESGPLTMPQTPR